MNSIFCGQSFGLNFFNVIIIMLGGIRITNQPLLSDQFSNINTSIYSFVVNAPPEVISSC